MDIENLEESIADLPKTTSIVLSKLFMFKNPDNPDEVYEVILDFPIAGIAYNEEDKELRFLVIADNQKDEAVLKKFGKLILKDSKALAGDGSPDGVTH